MADLILRDRAGDSQSYNNVDTVFIQNTEGNLVAYSLSAEIYDYSDYEVREKL